MTNTLREYGISDETFTAIQRQQKIDIAKALARRTSETASAAVAVLDSALTVQVLKHSYFTPDHANLIGSLMAGLARVNRTTGTVAGGDLLESDEAVFRAAAGYAGVAYEKAIALPAEVRTRMRQLTR